MASTQEQMGIGLGTEGGGTWMRSHNYIENNRWEISITSVSVSLMQGLFFNFKGLSRYYYAHSITAC